VEVYDQRRNLLAGVAADEGGNYKFTEAAGYYILTSSAEGYRETTRIVAVLGERDLRSRDLTMTPILQEGEVRIVLTWGQYPADLDSHLFGSNSQEEPFHINYRAKVANENGTLIAFLDLDDTSSYGPETTTIYNASADTKYSFAVHDFTNRGRTSSTALANSNANVKVYIGNEDMKEYNVPPGLTGDSWYVFDIINGEASIPPSTSWDW